jgi:hypothetical protein
LNWRTPASAIALWVAWTSQGCAAWAVDDCVEKANCTEAADDRADGPGALAAEGGSTGSADAAGDTDASGSAHFPDAGVLDGGSPDASLGDATRDAHAEADASAGDAAHDATTGATDVAGALDAGLPPDGGARDASAAPDAGATCIPTGPEQCDDGIDNDCNGKIDCADPACSAYACVPPVPSGWEGPVALEQVAAGSTLPACPTQYESLLDAHAGLTAPQAVCSCVCGASGQQCSATGAFHGDQTCSASACATVTPSPSGACTAVSVNSCGSGGSFDFTVAPSPSGGSCQAAVTTTVTPAGWTTAARLCAYAGTTGAGGCSDADACIALPSSPYGAAACVYSTADPPPTSCPAGYAGSPPAVFYAGVTDTRACGGCSCGGPTGGTCSGTVSLFGGAGCTGSGGTATAASGTSCQPYSGLSPTPGSAEAHFTVTGGSCAVSAAPQPVGSASGNSPTTVCCM